MTMPSAIRRKGWSRKQKRLAVIAVLGAVLALAAVLWQAAIDLSEGNEPWLAAARQGLSAAQNDGVDTTAADQAEMIRGMVEGLSTRLYADGGTVEEWARLVQSYIVLGDLPNAQKAYDGAVAAYPLAFDRGELDSLALGAGLKLNGDAQ